ncbi:hypothetical protein [Burkholderia stagnalis]|uniref:hypothetical protein n=1 Tax=Burkholderia stagnalis TaxID=1503054 RepID=UPI000F5BFE70|nr:hypothetical protein [Burkholderia stagnalis]RQP97732.1 hypothetical protein DF164_32390 [Burkholderia stagnalis]RQY32773.1 hypothetical protein DF113_31250 [Burkholderia stagnalis]
MSRRRPVEPLIRLFQEVSGEVPDEASLARMRRVSGVLNLQDNDALWSIIAVLEYYARLYEAMPERIRWAGEGSLEAARREVGGANDALMQQHRDALERCKATITLAESLIEEHEVRYREALATLNEAALTALSARLTAQVAHSAGNRLIGAMAVSAREQRERLDEVVDRFGQAADAAAARVEAMSNAMKRRFARAMRGLWLSGTVVLCLIVLVAGGWMDGWWGRHPSTLVGHAVHDRPVDGRP